MEVGKARLRSEKILDVQPVKTVEAWEDIEQLGVPRAWTGLGRW